MAEGAGAMQKSRASPTAEVRDRESELNLSLAFSPAPRGVRQDLSNTEVNDFASRSLFSISAPLNMSSLITAESDTLHKLQQRN